MNMIILQLSLLIIIGFIGIIFNWLLILAIQRKTYHYQYSHRLPSPTTNKPLLQPQPSLTGQILQPPLLPSVHSSVSIFDKFILAFLINDIFVCNFILPLRFIDISQGLPCGFLCFILKFFEKLTTTVELIIINLLLISTLFFFWKKRSLTTKLWFILMIFMFPILISCLITTLTYIDIDEDQSNDRPPTCKQTFSYINLTTHETFNIFCCFITYFFIFINFILLIKTKQAVKVYKKNSLKSLTHAAMASRTDASLSEQVMNKFFDCSLLNSIALFQSSIDHNNRRRSMYYAASITMEPANVTPPTKRSNQPVDYVSYLTVIENSHTLIRSTFLILCVYLLVHIPYWLYEFSNNPYVYQLKDLFFLSHIFKPFCYMLTNEKYRDHVWAIIKCKTFRMLPNLLRTKSRVVTFNNTNNLTNNY